MLQHAFKFVNNVVFLIGRRIFARRKPWKNRRSAYRIKDRHAWRGESCLHHYGGRFSLQALAIVYFCWHGSGIGKNRLFGFNALKISEIPIQVGASISRSMLKSIHL